MAKKEAFNKLKFEEASNNLNNYFNGQSTNQELSLKPLPKNKITANLYTNGGDFVYSSTAGLLAGTDYKGPFHVFNGRPFPGKDSNDWRVNYFGTNKEIIIPKPPEVRDRFGFDRGNKFLNAIDKINRAVGFGTAAFNWATQNINSANRIQDKSPNNKPIKRGEARSGVHAFITKTNESPQKISEVNLPEVSIYQNDPLYKVEIIDFSSPDLQVQIDNAEKNIPGIKGFIEIS